MWFISVNLFVLIFIYQFSVLLGAIFIMELVAGVTGYMLSDDTFDLLSLTLNKTMHEYNNSSKANQLLWDDMQQKVSIIFKNIPLFVQSGYKFPPYLFNDV
jgi:hypothetical protein